MILTVYLTLITYLIGINATVLETVVIERSTQNDHDSYDIRELYALIDSDRLEMPEDILIGESGAFVLINNENDLKIAFGLAGVGTYENNGDFYILDNSQDTKSTYSVDAATFTNNGVFQFFLFNENVGSGYNIDFYSTDLINNGILKFSATSSNENVGLVNFNSLTTFVNEQAVCLNSFQAIMNTMPSGSGCVVLSSTSILKIVGSASPASEIEIYMRDSRSIVYENIDSVRGTVKIHGFGNGNHIVLSEQLLTDPTYDETTGILTLITSGTQKLFNIGLGYDPGLFRSIDQLYSLDGVDSVSYSGPPPALESIPDTCLLCDQQVNDYSFLNEPFASYADETNEEIILLSSSAIGEWYTTTFSTLQTVTITTTINDEAVIQTEARAYTLDDNEIIAITSLVEDITSVNMLTVYDTVILDEPTRITAYIVQSTNENGDWVSISDNDLLGSETFTTRIFEDGSTKDAEVFAYTYAAGVYYITNTLEDPIAATETNFIDGRTKVVMVTSDEENWWYTTTSTVPRSAYTYTTVLSNENGAGTATHIVSANQDENEDWITQTSYHTPSSFTSLITMETTVDGDIDSYPALHHEYQEEDGNWVTATDTDLSSVETYTSRVLVTDEVGEHTRDAEIVQYQFAIAGNYYKTNLLDDPTAVIETKVVEDRTEIVMVTSDEENWWYTTTSTIPKSSYTYTTVLTDENGAGTATHIISANQDENDDWITQTSYHTPSHVTSLVTIETMVDEDASSQTALYYEYLNEDGDWVTTTDTDLLSIETFTSRVVVTDDRGDHTRDAEIVEYQFAIAGNYYVTNLLDDPIAATQTNVIDDRTEIVMVISDEHNWWYTTTSTVPRSSYTYTTVLSDENGAGTATHIVSANQDENEDWITQTSYHTPSQVTSLLAIETDVDDEISTVTALHYEYLEKDGDWVTTTDTDLLSIETFTTRVVVTDDGGEQTRDAEIVEYQFAIAGNYYVTNLLDDPIAATQTNVIDDKTEIVMVISDEHNWWYTTTSTVPRSSYTYTTVLTDENGAGTATHIISAIQAENDDWITQTSYHTPSSVTNLITLETYIDDETSTVTALYYEYLGEDDDWVTTTDTDLLSVETYTSRVLVTDEVGEHTRDAEIVQYQFAIAGNYYKTNLLDDPTAVIETKVVEDRTEIIMVTSDEENWWYTTTSTISRSSYTYTTVLTDENGAGTATHIISANQDENDDWITQTSYHIPSHVTSLITMETTVDEDVSSYTALHYEYLIEGGDWVTATDTDLISVETLKSRVVVTDEGGEVTRDAEIVQYQFAIAGDYYITSLLDDPIASTETKVIEDRTEVVMVTSDEENWWYTTTSTVPRSSYTYTTVLSDENGAGTATHVVSANQDENDEWITQTSYHTPSSVTSLLAIETDVDDETSTVTALHYEYLNEDGDWVTTTDTDLLSIETFTSRVVVTDEGGEHTRDAEIVQYHFAIAGNYYVTNILDDPIAATQTNVIDDRTEVVMVTSDEQSWWYTTTSTVPRSSYTYTTVLTDENGAGTATHIISAIQDENDEWITQTSYHTPSHVTSLVTIETTVDEDVSSQTALYYEYLNEDGDWVTTTDTDLLSVETFTSRVLVTDEGGEHTRDAEVLQYQFAIAGNYYVTNLLEDPTAATETNLIDDRTEVVMVTSDEENWWYTTTSTVPRSSYTYTTVLTDENGAGTATHIISANQDENDEWITQTSYHTPRSVTSLLTIETDIDDETITVTALHYEYLEEDGDWVTATDTDLLSVETYASRVLVTDEGGEHTRDAEILHYLFESAGAYYVTNLLNDPTVFTETSIVDNERTEVIIVTSDEENWWYTTTTTVPRSSYTYTSVVSQEGDTGAGRYIVSTSRDEQKSWGTSSVYYTTSESSITETVISESATSDSEESSSFYVSSESNTPSVTTDESLETEIETDITSFNVLVSEAQSEHEYITSNGTHLTLMTGTIASFIIEDGYLYVLDVGYIHIEESGLLLISDKENASVGWSMDESNTLYFIEDFTSDLTKREYAAYFSYCVDENGDQVLYIGNTGCVELDEAIIMTSDDIVNDETATNSESTERFPTETFETINSLSESFETETSTNVPYSSVAEETSVIETNVYEGEDSSETNVIETGVYESEETNVTETGVYESLGSFETNVIETGVYESEDSSETNVIDIGVYDSEHSSETNVTDTGVYESEDLSETNVTDTGVYESEDSSETNVIETEIYESSGASETNAIETGGYESEETNVIETEIYENSGASETNVIETGVYESSYSYETNFSFFPNATSLITSSVISITTEIDLSQSTSLFDTENILISTDSSTGIDSTIDTSIESNVSESESRIPYQSSVTDKFSSAAESTQVQTQVSLVTSTITSCEDGQCATIDAVEKSKIKSQTSLVTSTITKCEDNKCEVNQISLVETVTEGSVKIQTITTCDSKGCFEDVYVNSGDATSSFISSTAQKQELNTDATSESYTLWHNLSYGFISTSTRDPEYGTSSDSGDVQAENSGISSESPLVIINSAMKNNFGSFSLVVITVLFSLM